MPKLPLTKGTLRENLTLAAPDLGEPVSAEEATEGPRFSPRREPRTDRSPFVTRLDTGSWWGRVGSLQGSGQVLPQLCHWRRLWNGRLDIGAAVLVAVSPAYLPVAILPANLGGFNLTLLLLLLLRCFLGFSLLRHHWPPSRVKEAKHESRPYCGGLFNRRSKLRRIESLRLSTRKASGAEEEFCRICAQSAKNISGGLHIIRKAARVFFDVQASLQEETMHSRISLIALQREKST